jgi:metal-dependent amidase/aminoacylase/carboxypeptidase family protein
MGGGCSRWWYHPNVRLALARLLLLLLLLGLGAGPAAGTLFDPPIARIYSAIRDAESLLVSFRRDLHRHPETSGRERRTAALVAERMRALGWEVRTGIGGHGVVAILRGAKPGPAVAYRADMDAVSSGAPDPVEFRSITPGVRHICGHDIHTTVAVGIATALTPLRAELPGSVMLVFQPAEESARGAAAMLRDGVFGDPKPAAIFAVHCSPLEVGTVGAMDRLVLPGIQYVTAHIVGAGDVERADWQVRRLVQSLATVDDRGRRFGAAGADGPSLDSSSVPHEEYVWARIEEDPYVESRAARVFRVLIKAGGPRAREDAIRKFREGCAKVTAPGVRVKTWVEPEGLPATVNDSALVAASLPPLEAAVGKANVIRIRRAIPQFSEDFSRFQLEVPGAMYFLGVSNSQAGTVGMPHSPEFVADEGAILVGARAMANVLWGFLKRAERESNRGPRGTRSG